MQKEPTEEEEPPINQPANKRGATIKTRVEQALRYLNSGDKKVVKKKIIQIVKIKEEQMQEDEIAEDQ